MTFKKGVPIKSKIKKETPSNAKGVITRNKDGEVPREGIVIPYAPRVGQREVHIGMESHRWSLIVSHRRWGKTVCVINHLIKKAMTCGLRAPRYGYIAPELKQAKAVAWDFLKHYTAPIPGLKINESELWVEFPNKARIRLFGADNPDSLRGLYFDGVCLDEVAQMRPELWGEIIRPELSDRGGFAVFIGTPKGMNLFYELYQNALRDEEWYTALFRADKTGVIEDDELVALKRAQSESQFRQEYLCDFMASSESILISLDVVNDAVKREYDNDDEYAYAARVLSVDVARFGDDESIIYDRQGFKFHGMKVFPESDLMTLSDHVAYEIDKIQPDAVFVDVVGIGAGVVDRLNQLGYGYCVVPVNAGGKAHSPKYFNKRAEMWDEMRKWLLVGGDIPDDKTLIMQLTSVEYKYAPGDKLMLERKEDMKKRGLSSPDRADALALSFASPVSVGLDGEDDMEERRRSVGVTGY